MRPAVVGIVVLAGMMPATAAQQPPRDGAGATAPIGTARVIGRVTVLNANPAVPVRRAKVTLSSTALPDARIVDADLDGRYVFDLLPPGVYRVRAEKPGFVAIEAGASGPLDTPPPLNLPAGGRTTADMAMPRGAALSGTVTNADGEPLQNVIVSAVKFRMTLQGRRPWTVRTARTDDRGRYRLHSLAPGDYYLNAAPDPVLAITQFTLPGMPGHARSYYPGTVQPHEARRVRLTVGQEAPGLDFVVASAPMARVAGRLVDSSGNPAGLRGVRLQALGAPPGDVRGTPTQPPGGFAFPRVPPGDYWLAATTTGADADQEFAALRLSVSGQDITDLVVTTSKAAQVQARVEFDTADVPPAQGIQLVAIEPEFELPTGPSGLRTTIPADSPFPLPGMFGPRLFRVEGLPAGWALRTVLLDDVDVTDTVVDFRGGGESKLLRIVLTSRTASVEADVYDAGTPDVHARVIVFAEDERRWRVPSRFVATAFADNGGKATVQGLLPGKYLAAAVEHAEDGAWGDPDFLRRLRSGAATVTLTEASGPVVVKVKVMR